ncbi:SET and MYND domain-containing protein 4-like isoform X2 [Zootermopsis nevadensis]|uniref:Protein-lysine N-methyltransferase SMYD4 n=1 Tax=Zootermopsis nevadensis TaxID=136037 RepID=A0A067RTA7_ZOONE|nr:SET and MYND domain-containing protein 4-like isoform X2 [Zootermopsis nevadensis]KDR23054.1 SET and MYND domain-containing protein 4 [Zootermopsis nevadensis]
MLKMETVGEIFQELCSYLRIKRRVESVSELFAKQTSNSNRVEIASQLLKEHNLIATPGRYLRGNEKSLTRSIDLRNSGNKAFQKKDDKTALMLYTQSIATAPFPSMSKISNEELETDFAENEDDTSVALALALANRSAVLFSMSNYEACLSDIKQAMKYNYPNKLLYKLFERQGKCFQALGNLKSAMESLFDARKWLFSASALTEEKKETIRLEIENFVQHLANSKTTEISHSLQIEQPLLPSCSYGKNHEILCASDCVELKFIPEMGRYIVATRDIRPGDVLVVEKPFASVLLPDCYWTHCYNCLQPSQSLLPCYHCSTVMYCSEKCRTSSWDNSHYIDCPMLDILQKLKIGNMSFLALRIVILVCKCQDIQSLITSLEDEGKCIDRNRGFNNNGTYSSSDYSAIYWLVGNTEKREVGDLFRRAVTAACILNCLETMTDLFSVDTSSSPPDITNYKLLVGGLLLRHLQNLPCNAHEVSGLVRSETRTLKDGVPVWKSVEVGAAAHAVLSLLNHSCDPNVVRHSYQGDTAVLRAIRPIAKGEQVLDNYGYHYALHDRTERKSHLETQYHFTCMCVACTEDWPSYNLLPNINPIYLCARCRCILPALPVDPTGIRFTTCTNCSESHDMTDIISKIETSSEEFCQNLEHVVSGEGCDWEGLAQKLLSSSLRLFNHSSPYIPVQLITPYNL